MIRAVTEIVSPFGGGASTPPNCCCSNARGISAGRARSVMSGSGTFLGGEFSVEVLGACWCMISDARLVNVLNADRVTEDA